MQNTDNIIEIFKKLNIETDRKKMTVFDGIIIMEDLFKKNSIIRESLKKHDDNSVEFNLLKNIVLDKKYIICNILLNNHYSNPFLDVYFILSNAYLFTEPIFNVLYEKKDKINEIPTYIKFCWKIILNTDLKKFYNSFLINKWLQTLDFKIISQEEFYKIHPDKHDIYKKYLEIYTIFDNNVCKLKEFLFELSTKITNNNHPGCSNLSINYYYNFVQLNTGLIMDSHRIKAIFKFGLRELKRLSLEQKNIIYKVRPDLKHIKDNKVLLNTLKSDNKYKFKSEQEFINAHKVLIDKLHKYFIEEKKIKEFKKPNLVFINDSNLSAAYWAYDAFYLNMTNWNKANTYESLALTLHEAIPGHHTQLNYSIHSNNKDINVLYNLFGTTNGFCEGWALFIESSYPYYTDEEHIGRLQYEILRTLRIIVDILLNVVGIDINKCLNFMKEYITMDEKIIQTELIRYVSIPGQALCYKIGCEIFRKIEKKYDNPIELYKKLIYNKEKSLEAILIEYKLNFDDIFV